MFICGALQVAFVSAFATLTAVRPETAFAWLLPFVGVVWVLVLYNNWAALAARHRSRCDD